MSTTYMHGLVRLFLLADHHGKVVIVGRGTQFILPHNRGLSACVMAPFVFRVKHVLLWRGMAAKEAPEQSRDPIVIGRFCHGILTSSGGGSPPLRVEH